MKQTDRKKFNFYRSYYYSMNELKLDSDKLAFITAILDKQFLGVEPQGLNELVKSQYLYHRPNIDMHIKSYNVNMKYVGQSFRCIKKSENETLSLF